MGSVVRSMLVIAEPAPNTRTVLVPGFAGPVVKGAGSLDYRCGGCGATLLENVEFEQIRNIVVKCFGCGSFNETAPVNEMN